MNKQTWKPRWYYIMKNNTSGKLYVGQSCRDNMDTYCGSGRHWKPHCKKHGGYNRTNISIVFQEWFTEENEAQKWLNTLPEKYWGTDLYSNLVAETTEFFSIKGHKFSSEVKEKMSLAKIGFKHSEETKAKMSAGRQKENHPMWGKPGPMKGRFGSSHPMYGKPGPMLGKEGLKGGKNGMSRRINLINIVTKSEITFDSFVEGVRYLGIKSPTQIGKVIIGRDKFIAKKTLGETWTAKYAQP